MTTYQILRTEFTTSREGQDEIFIDLQLNDSTLGIINWPHWIKGVEAVEITANPELLTGRVEAMIPGIINIKAAELEGGQDD